MKTLIKAHHMSITEALKDYAESKIDRLEKFSDHIQSVTIDLDIDHASTDDTQQKASALIHVSGTSLKASEASESMYSSIDLMMDKLEAQLKKYKDKITDHRGDVKHQNGHQKFSINTAKKSKGERFIQQPMDPEEAVSILQREKLKVLVFRNLSDERINVIYPITDNEYGLIDIG